MSTIGGLLMISSAPVMLYGIWGTNDVSLLMKLAITSLLLFLAGIVCKMEAM